MPRICLFIPLMLLSACIPAQSQPGANHESHPASGELTVSDIRANMTVPSATGSFWMVIQNGTAADDALIDTDIAGCQAVEFHNMNMEDDVMHMHQQEDNQIPLPAGQTVVLEPGGLHLMCIGKEAPLEVGTTIDIVLQFANAGAINVTADVVEPDGG